MDSRVNIYNLKDDANLNTLPATERNSIWVPKLTFNNTKNNMQTVNDEKAIASAGKLGNYTMSGMDFADNVYIFKVVKNNGDEMRNTDNAGDGEPNKYRA